MIQHYVIKFVTDLLLVLWFFPGTPVSSTNKTDCHDIPEIVLQVALINIILIIYVGTRMCITFLPLDISEAARAKTILLVSSSLELFEGIE